MKTPPSEASSSPEVHSENIQRELTQLIEHLEADAGRVRDPRFRALVGKAGEVLTGLRKLFERFTPTEPAPKSTDRAAKAKNLKSPPDRPAKLTPPAPTPTPAGKKDAPTAKASNGTPSGKVANGKETKDAKAPAPAPASPSVTPPVALPIVAPKPPEDPDAIAARLKLQRQEARAPKRPGGQVAPKPIPAPSGKPIWSQPHSS